jgi:predicted nucleic acid-binding protein
MRPSGWRRSGPRGMSSRLRALPPGPVGVDTSPFIHFLEGHPRFTPALRALFASADAGERELVTSGVTLLEVLVAPMRMGDLALAESYQAILTRGRGLTLVELDTGLLRTAAALRAVHALRTPDALQVAACLRHRCGCFLTNDRRIPSLPSLPVVQLDDLVGPGHGGAA